MEHTSDIVLEGKQIGENTYTQRAAKNTELEMQAELGDDVLFAKMDFYDSAQKIVHEVKKSNKARKAHEAQIKFYLYILWLNHITEATGILEYPRTKERLTIELTEEDISTLKAQIAGIKSIIRSDQCPKAFKIPICRSCSYFEFCWIRES
jgi:CRISPR-associated exonuclease Cas4